MWDKIDIKSLLTGMAIGTAFGGALGYLFFYSKNQIKHLEEQNFDQLQQINQLISQNLANKQQIDQLTQQNADKQDQINKFKLDNNMIDLTRDNGLQLARSIRQNVENMKDHLNNVNRVVIQLENHVKQLENPTEQYI